MALSIFYDLETTDTCFLGQILNYSFIVVDDDWNIVDECNGLVRLSKLQLPTPGAILANRVDLLEHQQIAEHDERDAMARIHRFLCATLERAGDNIRLIGFNSAKFDLTYVRTCFIRNGLNPYIENRGAKIIHGDVMLAAQKLVTTSEEFSLMTIREETGEIKRRLTLQHLAQQFNILDGQQSHESRADVLLTIELAKIFYSRFGLDVRTWRSYEGLALHRTSRTGEVFLNISVEYDLSRDRSYKVTPVTLLDFSGNTSLWIDLDAYRDGLGRKAVMYRNCVDGPFFPTPCPADHREQLLPIARAALDELKHVSSKNFFPRSCCDIEADIYRLGHSERTALSEATRADKKPRVDDADVQELFRRHRLAHWTWGHKHDGHAEEALLAYAEYRYGGLAVIKKSFDPHVVEKPEGTYHTTLEVMIRDLYQRLEDGPAGDVLLLKSLETFYKESDIFRVLSQRGSSVLPARCMV